MIKKKFNTKNADLSILDQIIGKCEDAMVGPFKKKKPDAVAIEVEPKDDESMESPDEEKGEKPDLSDMDLEDLLRMYKDQQGE